MTAVISINTLAAPLGFLVAGQVLEHWGVVPFFAAAVVGGITWMAVVFAAIVHHRDAEPAPEAAPV